MSASAHLEKGPFEICFESLFRHGRAMVIPCDALGRVDLDTLPARARCNYLYARALVGRDYATPYVAQAAASAAAATSGRSQRRGADPADMLLFSHDEPAELSYAA
jgi:hypothetical protein